jgi:hypothetical protein
MADASTFVSDTTFAAAYTIIGGLLGLLLMIAASWVVPRIVDRLTPQIDDEKEILRGNLAVATYVGGITQAVIIGLSIIVAASIVAGMM